MSDFDNVNRHIIIVNTVSHPVATLSYSISFLC